VQEKKVHIKTRETPELQRRKREKEKRVSVKNIPER
jgi:hypothetical protein